MKLIAAAALSLALLSSGAMAQDDAKPEKIKKVPDPNKRICRSVAITGSRMSSSVCHTAAEWDVIRAGALSAQDADRIKQAATPQ